jgi:uncharacterized damage-inducible protein DinB
MSVFTNAPGSTAEETVAYVEAVLGLVGDRDPLGILRETPEAVRRAIANLPLAQLRQPEMPGKWSIAQVVQHLGDAEIVWAWRLRLILAQDRPELTGYDQESWASRLQYENADPAEALELFSTVRRSNLRLLERASPEDLKRVGVHSERGEESLAHLRSLYAGHDLLHLRQIERIRKAVSHAV